MDEPREKVGTRNAWGRIAVAYDELWSRRLEHYTARGLDLVDPEPGWRGLDVASGPGLTSAALAARLPEGSVLGVDFSPAMVARATERWAGTPGLAFAVGDAERLSQPDSAFDVVTCSFGLMYCYDARGAVGEMARVLSPGGRLMLLVWGRAARVWWSPVIELIETRAGFYSSICPMMFFYGLPGVLSRMAEEAGLEVMATETTHRSMRFPRVEDAVEAAVGAGPLQGIFTNRLDAVRQHEVRAELTGHVAGLAIADADGVSVPGEVTIVVARRPE